MEVCMSSGIMNSHQGVNMTACAQDSSRPIGQNDVSAAAVPVPQL